MIEKLVVVRAFGPYAGGEVIADAKAIATVLDGAHRFAVVRVQVKEG